MRYVISTPSSEQPLPGNIYIAVDRQRAIQTYEGVYAIDEAIAWLRKMKPVGPLMWNIDLHAAAKEHADDIGPLGLYVH